MADVTVRWATMTDWAEIEFGSMINWNSFRAMVKLRRGRRRSMVSHVRRRWWAEWLT